MMFSRLIDEREQIPKLVKVTYKYKGGHEWTAHFGRTYTGDLDKLDAIREAEHVRREYIKALAPFLEWYR